MAETTTNSITAAPSYNRFRWSEELIIAVVNPLQSYKCICYYNKGIDCNVDEVKQNEEIQGMLAQDFPAFGTVQQLTEKVVNMKEKEYNKKKILYHCSFFLL